MTDAVDAAEKLMSQPGWELRASVQLARLRAELFDPAGAAVLLKSVLKRDPSLSQPGVDSRELKRFLVRCLLRCGRPAEARALLPQRTDPALDPELTWLLSRALLQEGQDAQARSALEKAKGFGSSDPLLDEPAPFVGAARCLPCHQDQYTSQQKSRHARTSQRSTRLRTLPWPDRVVVDRDNPSVAHQVQQSQDRIEVITRVDRDHRALRAVVEYALGSNHQGQSFLGRDDQGQVRELRLSHYPSAPEWDRTMEHPTVPPDLEGYLGRPISPESFRRCLHCHATNFRSAQEPEGRPESHDHGIGCERCHGPAGHHLLAIAAGLAEPAIARPRLASAAQVVALCGECHTAPPGTTPASAKFVRYQATGFTLSRCYAARRGDGFSCVSCHDPHEDAETSTTFYEAKCISCHSSDPAATPGAGVKPVRTSTSAACPVNPGKDCLTCHMPKIKDAVPRTEFTDHQIRIHRK
jgi:hypothetical protein